MGRYNDWWGRFTTWLWLMFGEKYDLTVWYVYETEDREHGIKITRRKERKYELRDIKKRTNKHITGTAIDGSDFEIKTVDPFDFEIRRGSIIEEEKN